MENNPGRPPFEITPDIIEQVESYAARGLSKRQIALCLGISYQTLNEKSKAYSDFSYALKRGRSKGVAHVANQLIKNAENGNVTAQIYYLKCQGGKRWRDKEVKEVILQTHEQAQKATVEEINNRIAEMTTPKE